MIKLIGILVVAVGFVLRFNTLLVVMAAGIATGLVAGMSLTDVLEQFGKLFLENRYMTLPVLLIVPVVGLLERHGLRERAETLIRRAKGATAGRVILIYCAVRQLSIALGVNIGGHAGAVRPIIAPMAEGAAHARHGELPDNVRQDIRAHAAAAENVGNFFGEDIFVAVGAVLLMKGFFDSQNLDVNVLAIALWGLPTAFAAFGAMGWRSHALDRRIAAATPAQSASINPFMTLVSLNSLYILGGLLLAFVAIRAALDTSHSRRLGTALFWGALAVIYLFGNFIPPLAVGWLMVVLVTLAATKQISAPAESPAPAAARAAEAQRLGNTIFLPALLIPATAIAGALLLGKIQFGSVRLLDARQTTLAALGLGAIFALLAGLHVTRAAPLTALREGGRLLHAIGWTLLLPQLLAALGGIFAKAGVGAVVSGLVAGAFPTQIPFVAVAVYCVGMALFTICLGNAFAAFPVITLGIGLPIIVRQHGGNPAIMAALGMLSGYCGTLLTPMAANFNLVPVMLLDLRDPNAVIKAQFPIALVILIANILILYACVYRF